MRQAAALLAQRGLWQVAAVGVKARSPATNRQAHHHVGAEAPGARQPRTGQGRTDANLGQAGAADKETDVRDAG